MAQQVERKSSEELSGDTFHTQSALNHKAPTCTGHGQLCLGCSLPSTGCNQTPSPSRQCRMEMPSTEFTCHPTPLDVPCFQKDSYCADACGSTSCLQP